ncbi:MAG: hypothetical protein GOMPHAMPRED_007546 [Gomphillus americanus]|uniref:Major facilitator superfamily (MFS) profile domain-containing protein n=1 Tax=Gomphillus americanus TaxID=1940652 RepID=A0A8H3ESU0_9LECA|nr:MAG: hypothetical protein GOMPHAMPRED_007546 [Gomphillus americanus]
MSSDSMEKRDPSIEEKLPAPSDEMIEASHNVELDPLLDRRITRKLDMHLLPWLFGIWFFAFIDRSNIGNAKISGLTTDLSLDGVKFNVVLSVFYILYILVDIPSNLIVKRIGAGHYIPMLMTGWGIVTTFMGLTKSYAGLIVCRILLGLFEGGLFGGMILYVSMFYPRHQILLRLGLWYCAAPLSGAIGGLLAAGLSQIHYDGYNSWPWIFIIEGAITTVFGSTAYFFLPHTPGTARFFTPEEQEAAVRRMHTDLSGAAAVKAVDQETFDWRWVKMALFNVNTALCCLNFFLILVPIYSYSLFLPTIIAGLGYKGVIAQLFTVPPNFLGFLSVIGCAYFSDRYKIRGPVIIAGALFAMIGYIMQIAGQTSGVKYAGTFFVAAGVFQMSPTVNAWLANNLAPHYVRATGGGLQVAIGNCAAFVATFTYLAQDGPNYITGHSINLGALVLIVVVSCVNMAYVVWENKKRANGDRDHRLTKEDEASLGFLHPRFRYTI